MRYYSSIAEDTTLTTAVNSTDTALVAAAIAGYPSSYPYTLVLDPDTPSEELVSVTNASGTTFTVTRAQDGTTGVSHAIGAVVKHAVSGRDYSDAQTHIAATAAHGVSGDVVGTTDAQTLTNKTLTTPTIASMANANHTHADAAGGGKIPESSVTNLVADLAAKAPVASPTFTGTVTVVSPTAAGSTGARQVTMSTSDPSGGADGDVWLKYV
jgi:hypothetical protein